MFNTIIISNSASFPWGMAASNRVRNLAKGLILNKCTVEYLGLRGADIESQEDKKQRGIFDGIKYSYQGGSPVRSKYWLMRRLDDLFGLIFSITYVLRLKFIGKLDAVIIYSMQYRTVIFWTHFIHLINVPVILEICEWPLARVEGQGKKYNDAYKFCYKAVPRVDAVLPISAYIENEIKKISESLKKNIPCFSIPILIDIPSHKLNSNRNTGQQYLMYSGAIGYIDIAKLIIDVLQELNSRGINLKIKFTGMIVGPFEKEQYSILRKYSAEKNVLSQLEFTGYLKENELHNLMHGATALLAPLPETVRSESRFPTKLGYYLISGAPVVTNAVGEVNSYLKDDINAFVAEKFDARQIADKIEKIINNPDLAEKVGQNGQKLAMEKFHYTSACKGIGDFVQQVISNYR